jgi:hypothetical protein
VKRAFLIAIAVASAASAEEVAAPAPSSAWELDAFIGYGRLAFPTTDTADVSSANGGPGFALTAAYRGPHFTHPFFDIAYVPILSSTRQVNVFVPGGSPGTVQADNLSYAIGFVLGPGWDIDWFRLRTGVGLYDTVVKTTVNGTTNKPSSLDLGFLVTASALVWRTGVFAVGIEGRLAALQVPTVGISQTMWEIGVTGRWDFAHPR